MDEWFTRNYTFVGIEGKFSPIKKAISHEIDITDNHQGIK